MAKDSGSLPLLVLLPHLHCIPVLQSIGVNRLETHIDGVEEHQCCEATPEVKERRKGDESERGEREIRVREE